MYTDEQCREDKKLFNTLYNKERKEDEKAFYFPVKWRPRPVCFGWNFMTRHNSYLQKTEYIYIAAHMNVGSVNKYGMPWVLLKAIKFRLVHEDIRHLCVRRIKSARNI